ncbi:MAG: fluoride efflux transporter CrcB [Actinomycetota bacterium]|nr:fluoride efflux transporter CrcB [Actinomycetota bacterium]
MTVLLVFAGGALGSVLRYLTDRLVQSRHRIEFPFGTLTVNLVGCFVLGLVAGGVVRSGWPGNVQSLVGTGLCGGLTTYSAFSVEVLALAQRHHPARAAGYVALSVTAGIALAAAGWTLA